MNWRQDKDWEVMREVTWRFVLPSFAVGVFFAWVVSAAGGSPWIAGFNLCVGLGLGLWILQDAWRNVA